MTISESIPSTSYPEGAELPSLAGIEQAHARIKCVRPRSTGLFARRRARATRDPPLPCAACSTPRADLMPWPTLCRQYIHRTPLQTSQTLNARATAALGGLTTADGRSVRVEVALKCENLQRIGGELSLCLLLTTCCQRLTLVRRLLPLCTSVQDPRRAQRDAAAPRGGLVDGAPDALHPLVRQPRPGCPSILPFLSKPRTTCADARTLLGLP